MSPDQQEVCGVETHRGEPCQLSPAWGRKDAEEGPCKYHTEERTESLKADVREVADLLEEELVSLQKACARVGISVPTLHRMRQKYPQSLGRRLDNALSSNLKARGTSIEDAVFQQILKGERGDALTKFMLQNYLPERFRDRKTLEVQGREEDPVDKLRDLYEEEYGLKVEEDADE